MGVMTSFAVIRRRPEHAERVQEILNLPDDRWSELQIEFGLEEVGTAKVTFLLTGEQLVALAELAVYHTDDCAVTADRSIESVRDDLLGEQLAFFGEGS